VSTDSDRPARQPRHGLGPAFGNLFTASLASNLGDGIARTAIPLLAVRLTEDPVQIAAVAALSNLPWLFFAIASGILVDRIDRRFALASSQAVRVLLSVALIALVATGQLTIWWLFLVVFVYGAFETVYDNAARAVVPSIVGRVDLPRANARIEAGELVTQNFLAGPFTSMLFAVAVLIPLGANALLFAVAGVLALLLPKAASGRQHVHADDAGVAWYRQFADGFRFIRSNRMLMTLWMVSTIDGLFFSLGTATLVLWVLGPLGVAEAWFGVFMLSGAIGGIAGSMVTAALKTRFGTGPVMAAMMVVTALGLLLFGAVPQVWAGLLAFAVSSAAITIWNVLMMSIRQAAIPGRLLGRVHGTWRTLLWGSMPLGTFAGGFIGRIDLALPFFVGGVVCLAVPLVFYRFLFRLPNPEDIETGDDPRVQ
jgi:Na+/melibiose symporter-like transporter